MILIEVQGRCVVHTGDFRWSSSMAALPCLSDRCVHTVFLDCTYAKPQFTFPSRESAAAQVVSLARQHAGHIIYIAVDTLGKEELLVAVAQALNERVFVSLDRFLRMSLCEFDMSLFTSAADAARIRTMDRRQLTAEFIRSRQQAQACIGIVPTGWSLESSPELGSKNMTLFYTVPYSLHSSFDELVDFVRCMRPLQVVPTSDSEAGGLESCSALCRRALGSETDVRVTALSTVLRSHGPAASYLGKRNCPTFCALSRSKCRASQIGAAPDSPSPSRTTVHPTQHLHSIMCDSVTEDTASYPSLPSAGVCSATNSRCDVVLLFISACAAAQDNLCTAPLN
jgi:hypothetical protein